MGWMAFVETDYGDTYRLIRPDGKSGGKALLSFLSIANSGCVDEYPAEDGVEAWISDFDEGSKFDFCELITNLASIYYSGNWEYDEDEYEVFLMRFPEFQLTEEEFQQTINAVNDMWINVQELIDVVDCLLTEFKKGYLEETNWYVELDTIGDLEGLMSTLNLAKGRNAGKVRIRID